LINELIDRLEPHALPLIFLGSVATLGSAYIFQALGYAPCDLCWYQRYPYMGIIAIGALALVAARMGRVSTGTLNNVLLICILLLLLDGAIAGFHAGVEYGWWQGPTACSTTITLSGTIEERLAQLQAAPIIRCDVAAWTMGGISMAGYNFFVAGAMALFGLLAWRKRTNVSE
jgi:disulfide bond formation protein DsbB